MRVRDVWLGFKRPRSCRAFSCMKSWSLVPPQATIFQALVIWEEARRLPSSGGSALPGNPGGSEPGGRGGAVSMTLPQEANLLVLSPTSWGSHSCLCAWRLDHKT